MPTRPAHPLMASPRTQPQIPDPQPSPAARIPLIEMIYLAASIVTLSALLGIVLTLITLPGIWFMIGVALLCFWWQPDMFSLWTLGAAIALGILAEIAELITCAAGAGKAGGTRHGAWGSIVGSLVGLVLGTFLILIPILGSLIGAVVGAFAGAVLAERGVAGRPWGESMKSGHGAAIGRLLSSVIKSAFAAAVAMILIVDAFWN